VLEPRIKFGDFSAARQIVAAHRLGSARVVPPPSAGKMPLVGNARDPEAPSTRGSIPARDEFCWRRPLLGLDPFGLLGEPEPFAHKVVIARPKIRAARFMSFLQRQRGLVAIPLRSRQHADRTCKNQIGSRTGLDRSCVISVDPWTLSPSPLRSLGKGPGAPAPSVAEFQGVNGPLPVAPTSSTLPSLS
jgi:hypothetical protein